MKNENPCFEPGKNELEILEFTIDGEIFGINVNKVHEIMKYSMMKSIQSSNPAIEGLCKLRDEVFIIVNLGSYLHLNASVDKTQDIFIIADVNNRRIAFHVHKIVGINCISLEKIQNPDVISDERMNELSIGFAEFENRLINLLNFEKIISDLCPEINMEY